MNNRKRFGFFFVIILLGICFWFVFRNFQFLTKTIPSSFSLQQATVPLVHVSIIGETISVKKDIAAGTVYDALMIAAEQQSLNVKTKHYDFGVFVEAIGDILTNQTSAWIYYVNGKAGTIACDKQKVQEGDQIEWRFEKMSL